MHQRILIFLFGDIGDTLLTVPAIQALRTTFPQSRLILLAKPTPASIIDDFGLVDQTIVVDKHVFDTPQALLRPTVIRHLLHVVAQERRVQADTVVLFHHLVTRWGTVKFALLSLASGAKCRVGLDNGRGWFLTHAVQDRGFGARHEADYYLDVARLVGADGPLHLISPVRPADREAADRILGSDQTTNAPMVAIHPGTGWYGPGRRWPPANFALTARLVEQRLATRWVLVGSNQDQVEADEVARLLGDRALNLVGRTSMRDLAAVLERCALLIANDGGVAHVASSVGTPVVSIFGPSNDRAWRPLTATVVAADIPCRPCFYRDFSRGLPHGCGSRECLDLVTPQRVANTVLQVMDPKRHDPQ